jgi:long-subunit fatty acid transport protein
MKRFGSIIVLAGMSVCLSHTLDAQSFVESALLFSRTQTAGNARIQAMGGAQTALGGDISTAASNPAGLGMYNRSEFSVTGSQLGFRTGGDYFSGDNLLSTGNNANRGQFRVPNFGLVFSSDKDSNGILKGNFAISQTRLNDFNQNIDYQGLNPNTSVIDYFIEDATGFPPTQFQRNGDLFNTPTELAYNNYLIGEATILNPNNRPTDYFTDVAGQPNQSETIERRGAQNQWNFSYGVNVQDKLFLGAGLGIASIRYQSRKVYRETFQNEPLDNLRLQENLEIRGSGINLNLGAIYRIKDVVQLGASYITPTGYSLTDSYNARMNTSWKNFEYQPGEFINEEESSTDVVISEYSLRTPGRLNLGATFFAGKNGFITADVERVNYSGANYRSNTFDVSYDSDNDRIQGLYKSVMNIRVGGEFRVKQFRFRGGYQLMPDPFVSEQNGVSRSWQTVSGGVGYRQKNFFIDITGLVGTGNTSYRPYRVSSPAAPLLVYQEQATQIIVTVGWPF